CARKGFYYFDYW
nr:immunoglobulin heavy chain junction region [Mus musculus]MBK4196265.1 immunoglobulin heavy chain junction region [Mus musculus]